VLPLHSLSKYATTRLEALGVYYRKIPILAIGRDNYLDSQFIIEKLEIFFPEGALRSTKPFKQDLDIDLRKQDNFGR
jgi:hypothetical protein